MRSRDMLSFHPEKVRICLQTLGLKQSSLYSWMYNREQNIFRIAEMPLVISKYGQIAFL